MRRSFFRSPRSANRFHGHHHCSKASRPAHSHVPLPATRGRQSATVHAGPGTRPGGCEDCPVWAEQKAPRPEQRAGSEEAGLLRRGVRLRVGRSAESSRLPLLVCVPAETPLTYFPDLGRAQGGAAYGSRVGEKLEGRWGEEWGPVRTRRGSVARAGVGWGQGGTKGRRRGNGGRTEVNREGM